MLNSQRTRRKAAAYFSADGGSEERRAAVRAARDRLPNLLRSRPSARHAQCLQCDALRRRVRGRVDRAVE
eukprot:8044465-Pyramimonas_sp.AAC.1